MRAISGVKPERVYRRNEFCPPVGGTYVFNMEYFPVDTRTLVSLARKGQSYVSQATYMYMYVQASLEMIMTVTAWFAEIAHIKVRIAKTT